MSTDSFDTHPDPTGQRLAALEHHTAALATRVDQLDTILGQLASPADGTQQAGANGDSPEHADAGGAARSPQPVYSSVHEWVADYFVVTFARPLGQQWRWCARWFDHTEAVERLEGLWRTWEQLRLDPVVGMATWLRDHLDHQLPILLGPAGPFRACTPDRHNADEALTVPASRTDPNSAPPREQAAP